MGMRLRLTSTFTVCLLVMTVASAGGEVLKPGAVVKGATYAGVIRGETITLTVAANGKTAKVSLPAAPAYCQGGGGDEQQSSKPAEIGKSGEFTVKINYFVPQEHRRFATITVSGYFLGEVFDGHAQSRFTPATSCDGQESFQATAHSR